MKNLSQFIAELQALESEYGDTPVLMVADGSMETPDAVPIHGGPYDNTIMISWT